MDRTGRGSCAAPGGYRPKPGGCDAGQDEVDAGQELVAVVVPGQLRRYLVHKRVPRRVELRPLCGEGGEEGRPAGPGRDEAGSGSVLPGESEDVVQQRGRAVELRWSG